MKECKLRVGQKVKDRFGTCWFVERVEVVYTGRGLSKIGSGLCGVLELSCETNVTLIGPVGSPNPRQLALLDPSDAEIVVDTPQPVHTPAADVEVETPRKV